jgi:hypothetical protein
MKKMLVFGDEHVQDRVNLDDFLYDSEVTRDDFVNMEPTFRDDYLAGGIAIMTSSWDIVFKDDDKYDVWHFLVTGKDPYDFEEPCHKAAAGLFSPYQHKLLFNLRAVLFTKGNYVLIYRLPKKLSELIDLHLPQLADSFDGTTYTHRIPEDVLGPLIASLSKEEAA